MVDDKMKVKFVSTYPPRKCGVGDHARHLADSLKKVGIEPEIVEIKKPTTSNPFYFIELAQKTAKGTSEKDIIHIQFHLSIFGKFFMLPGLYFIFFLTWLNLLTKAKIVVALHDTPSKELAMKGGKKEKLLFYYNKFIYIFLKLGVDKFITHSKMGEEINIKEWKIDPKKVITLPLGLPVNVIRLNQNQCKKKIGYPNKKILLLLGFIRNSKNYEVVLEALKKLDKEVILIIAGKPQTEKDKKAVENILKKIEELKLKNRVRVLGFVEDEKMPVLLNSADISIILHVQGGGDFMSSTMAMQLAYNIPLLSTNIPSFENLKKEEKCIETFIEDDSEDLAIKIKKILNSKSETNYLKTQSKKYWEKNNWNEIGKRTKEMYLSMLK
jgi:glycosyltransferase involved in cell wall biosynthesis